MVRLFRKRAPPKLPSPKVTKAPIPRLVAVATPGAPAQKAGQGGQGGGGQQQGPGVTQTVTQNPRQTVNVNTRGVVGSGSGSGGGRGGGRGGTGGGLGGTGGGRGGGRGQVQLPPIHLHVGPFNVSQKMGSQKMENVRGSVSPEIRVGRGGDVRLNLEEQRRRQAVARARKKKDQ
ncbi:MAG TPA: hypothetical protein VJA40_02180 [archaeon]|nr:hypothetical protein [archaeon]